MKQSESRFYLVVILSVWSVLFVLSLLYPPFVNGEIVYTATFVIVVLLVFLKAQGADLGGLETKHSLFAVF
jgi:hypothetical protein